MLREMAFLADYLSQELIPAKEPLVQVRSLIKEKSDIETDYLVIVK